MAKTSRITQYKRTAIRRMKKDKTSAYQARRVFGRESRAYGHIRPALVQDVEVLEEAANRIERFVKSL